MSERLDDALGVTAGIVIGVGLLYLVVKNYLD